MADRTGAVRRYLRSRKNVAGLAGALAGAGLHLAGLVDQAWPLVAAGLYAVAALVTPSARAEPPAAEPSLVDALRTEVEAQLTRVELQRDELPAGAEAAVRRIARTLRLLLDRLDRVPDLEVDRRAAPERLAEVAEVVRADLAECLDAWFAWAPAAPPESAARELSVQLDLITARVERLEASVPDAHARRAEDLTEEMRRRHDQA
ncbi:MAG TPA: hypothetical protein VKZ81_23385 [Pseudonocardia sp.]|jgi:hypothetical protein|uniref:hypothetical protein n=1 Tax=Pseudonocardia sp. TaxID=60912 RepID=UPI002B4B10B3|nr:hypothetical protein [Pseudonocardia sp.]HLU58411.1 hypothetical protein [Pseudonocardia sp.]